MVVKNAGRQEKENERHGFPDYMVAEALYYSVSVSNLPLKVDEGDHGQSNGELEKYC